VLLGHGSRMVSLIAGAHSDEPVGPETLRWFVLEGIRQREKLAQLFESFTFLVVPHINPDGEVKNQSWIQQWPEATAYLQHAYRELPGRDLEFGFPRMRQENVLVADFLKEHAPFTLHLSLHGMGFAEGAMLLIERHWIDRTQKLRTRFAEQVRESGLALHDHDRKGDKGFCYIGPGFTTTPEGLAMRAYFKSTGDVNTAKLFHDSSMEFVRKLGGDPLCLVPELPLFIVGKAMEKPTPGVPSAYLAFKEKIPQLKIRLVQGLSVEEEIEAFKIKPLALKLLVQLQLLTIQLGLQAVSGN
ncbi:MAG: M14 family zinc carboxypeptidase, partial [bacterium]